MKNSRKPSLVAFLALCLVPIHTSWAYIISAEKWVNTETGKTLFIFEDSYRVGTVEENRAHLRYFLDHFLTPLAAQEAKVSVLTESTSHFYLDCQNQYASVLNLYSDIDHFTTLFPCPVEKVNLRIPVEKSQSSLPLLREDLVYEIRTVIQTHPEVTIQSVDPTLPFVLLVSGYDTASLAGVADLTRAFKEPLHKYLSDNSKKDEVLYYLLDEIRSRMEQAVQKIYTAFGIEPKSPLEAQFLANSLGKLIELGHITPERLMAVKQAIQRAENDPLFASFQQLVTTWELADSSQKTQVLVHREGRTKGLVSALEMLGFSQVYKPEVLPTVVRSSQVPGRFSPSPQTKAKVEEILNELGLSVTH